MFGDAYQHYMVSHYFETLSMTRTQKLQRNRDGHSSTLTNVSTSEMAFTISHLQPIDSTEERLGNSRQMHQQNLKKPDTYKALMSCDNYKRLTEPYKTTNPMINHEYDTFFSPFVNSVITVNMIQW